MFAASPVTKRSPKALTMKLLVVFVILFASAAKGANRTFPYSFVFGVKSSAYQTEGAWNEDGKGENIWDRWIHSGNSNIKNNDTGDIACDSYRLSNDDLLLAATDLEVDFYAISISWSRILPTGFDNEINMKAIQHYQSLLNNMSSLQKITFVTLYHNDLPQPLQDIGGWTNPDMVNYYVNYARVLFQNLKEVSFWITFDDPRSQCRLGYGEGVYAPGIALDGYGEYLCAYTMLKSHAAVYRMHETEFPGLHAIISIAIDLPWSEPATNSAADIEAAERRNMFEFGLYAHPILVGNWPQVVIDRVAYRSKSENLTRSRLPEFTQDEIDNIKGTTTNFIAVNMRYTELVKDIPEPEFGEPGYMKDMRVETSLDPEWSDHSIFPLTVRKSLNWLKNTYDNPRTFITGYGVSDDGSTYEDVIKVNYHRDFLNAILDAIYEDVVRVVSYSVRSLLDCFEWTEGFSQHYGLYAVNRTDFTRQRKASARFYREVATTRQLAEDETTTTTVTTTTTTPTPTTTGISTTTGAASRNMFCLSVILFVTLSFHMLV